ncbi:hypothetical protein DFH09DRAFT_1329217 [Mycena vulgaris]|nr:hypothetical protein DFH09DRAFT_1329217 [Mycena vulgaris]
MHAARGTNLCPPELQPSYNALSHLTAPSIVCGLELLVGDCDAVRLAGGLVGRGDVEDAVGIDVEGDLDLRHTTGRESSIADLEHFAAESEIAVANSPPEQRLERFSRLDGPAYIGFMRIALSDFDKIVGFDPDAYEAHRQDDLAWLETAVADVAEREPRCQVVVLTHHASTVADTSDPAHAGGTSNSAFATEVLWRVCAWGSVAVWASWHTHWNCHFERAGVRVVANQRGYRGYGKNDADRRGLTRH